MQAKYINPFVSSTIYTLKQFIPDLEVERGDLSLSESPFKTEGTATYLGISGDLRGRIIYEMSRETALRVAGAMNDEEFDELNDMVSATIRELSNIISGNAATELRQQTDKNKLDITPPSIITGSDIEITDSMTSELFKVPLNTCHGTVIINIALASDD